MKARTGGNWRFVKPSVNVANTWKSVASAYVNVQGVWRPEAREVMATDQLSDIINDTSGWTYSSTVGWYKNDYKWDSTTPSKFSAETLARIRKVSAKFVGYYDVPAGSLGLSLINIVTNLGTVSLGTRDSHDDPAVGQYIQGGDVADYRAAENINRVLTYTLKANETVSAITIVSAGFNDANKSYPFSTRGITNFTFELL